MAEKKFPDEYRDALERFLRQRAQEAPTVGLGAVADLQHLLARIREPGFGLCASCGAVLALARLIRNLSLTKCEQCEATAQK